MGAKFFICLMMIVLVVSPAFCAEWIVRVELEWKTGREHLSRKDFLEVSSDVVFEDL